MNNTLQALYFGNVALDRERARKVGIYGRVSTQHEAQVDALGNQMQWYEDQTKYHPNWTIVERYIDEGITGTLAKKRPAFMRMISDAKNGKFDLIVTREVCRFARNTVDTLMITRELKNYGVEIFFVSDNIWTMDGDGELRLSIMATMAQEESRKISERVLAGQAMSRANGVLYGNGNIIGYDLDKVKHTYVINEEQAVAIRTIYELYSQGYGEKKIVNELCARGCKDSNGKVSWSCAKVSRILRNATYMGYIGYNKSKVNNYLEKKRINNLDTDSFIYVKGDFEPIISEELWRTCERIRKDRICVSRMPNGEERRKGTQRTKLLWVSKLRCRCGSSYRRYKWRVLADGTPVYGYSCNKRVVNPTRTFVLKNNLTEQLSCDAISIPEWKLEMMAKFIFDRVWGDQKEAVLKACQLIENSQAMIKNTISFEACDLQHRLEKAKKRKRRYAVMYADGDLVREEYQSLCAEADEEIRQLEIKGESSQAEPTPASLNISQIRKALEQIVDVSGPSLDNGLIEQFVEVVTPIQNYAFRWKLNFDKPKMQSERADLSNPSDPPIMQFTISFEEAKAYRKSNKMSTQFRERDWTDLSVEVYL